MPTSEKPELIQIVLLIQGEDPPVKFKRYKSVRKQMVASFFEMGDHVATVPLEDRRTLNADWYTSIFLLKIFESWCERRRVTAGL